MFNVVSVTCPFTLRDNTTQNPQAHAQPSRCPCWKPIAVESTRGSLLTQRTPQAKRKSIDTKKPVLIKTETCLYLPLSITFVSSAETRELSPCTGLLYPAARWRRRWETDHWSALRSTFVHTYKDLYRPTKENKDIQMCMSICCTLQLFAGLTASRQCIQKTTSQKQLDCIRQFLKFVVGQANSFRV